MWTYRPLSSILLYVRKVFENLNYSPESDFPAWVHCISMLVPPNWPPLVCNIIFCSVNLSVPYCCNSSSQIYHHSTSKVMEHFFLEYFHCLLKEYLVSVLCSILKVLVVLLSRFRFSEWTKVLDIAVVQRWYWQWVNWSLMIDMEMSFNQSTLQKGTTF